MFEIAGSFLNFKGGDGPEESFFVFGPGLDGASVFGDNDEHHAVVGVHGVDSFFGEFFGEVKTGLDAVVASIHGGGDVDNEECRFGVSILEGEDRFGESVCEGREKKELEEEKELSAQFLDGCARL